MYKSISQGVYSLRFTAAQTIAAIALLAGLALPVRASELQNKTFEFGPGTSQHHSHYRTLLVPARTTVSVAVRLQRDSSGTTNVPVVIEVRQASADSVGTTGPDGPQLATRNATATPTETLVAFENQSFTSQFGCPSTWRVRVRTSNSQQPPVRVFGTIVYAFSVPGTVNLDMEGGTQHLDPNATATRILAGVSAGASSRSLIAGTGTFRIRGKWHTDPANLLQLNTYHRLTVALVRPNGTVAASENGFSQHAPSDRTPKVNFTYTVTPQDAVMTGTWGLRISNNSSVRIVDFDIDRGIDPNPLMPNFTSTFAAGCN